MMPVVVVTAMSVEPAATAMVGMFVSFILLVLRLCGRRDHEGRNGDDCSQRQTEDAEITQF
jgi:hypothetical protein